MRCPISALAALLVALPLGAAAQPTIGSDVPVPEDLLAVLKLRGKRCAAIESWQRRAESDFDVRCTDGPRYRIWVSDDDRVEIEEPPAPR